MASSILFFSFLLITSLLFSSFTSSTSHALSFKTSAISAAPSLLPIMPIPKSSSPPPAMSPDSMPLLPTPGGDTGPAPEGSLPTIPSSPSPPNPDAIGPESAFAPTGLSSSATAVSPAAKRLSAGVPVVSGAAVLAAALLSWLLDY